MKIALLGYGKMGKTIEQMAIQKGHEVSLKTTRDTIDYDLHGVDVAIEFSSPESAVANILKCFEYNIPVISGTTGWLDHYSEVLNICEERNGSFIYASNFSIGVNLFFTINEYVAALMKPWQDYAVSMEEIHHTQKKDAPSGTAISLAEGIIQHTDKKGWSLEDTSKDNIPIVAKRIEDVKGTHSISYTSNVDTISIAHEAHSREGFAMGAIIAAEWLQGKKGVYTMKDVLHIK